MAEVVFVPDVIGWQREFRSWSGVVGRHMVKVGTKHKVLSKLSAPGPGKRPRNRTGLNYGEGVLENAIINGRSRWGTELEVQTIALPRYAIFVHEGTVPHVIVPKTPNGILKFNWHGKPTFRKIVHHPGTRRVPFLSENLRPALR